MKRARALREAGVAFRSKGQTMEAGIAAFTDKLQGEMESARQAEQFREAQDPAKRPGGIADAQRVRVQGTSRDDLNGQMGTVASYDPIAERYHVVLDGKAEGEEPLGLRPQHVVPLVEG